MLQHESIFEVRGYELDSFGHLNNSVYLNYLEEARWEFCREYILVNNGGKYEFKNDLFLVVIETNIKYIRELVLFDKVMIKSKYTCEGDTIIGDYVLINVATNKKVATSTSKLIFVNKDRIIHSIPDELKDLLKG
ncbi:acyl-CoA thioesterase [Alkaliphilus transvaalensis]|uniref:acyl-CoA thioesterase n=1 Tax=Alkaliphilus transvaalensis TaxID=114628 RepID=UPI00047906A4|nr:acyl-CoA thioesterase [Alkaliphilus transvaalensis]